MDKEKSLVNELKNFKKKTSKSIPISRMIFFGSRVVGKAKKWSDIDLVIVSPKFNRLKFRKRVSRMYDYWDLDYPVDFLCYSPEEFKNLSKQVSIVSEAIKNGIEI